MRSYFLLFLLLGSIAVADDKPAAPAQAVPPAPVQTSPYVTVSAVEAAQFDIAEDKASIKKAKKLILRAQKLQMELSEIQAQLNQLNSKIGKVVKVR